MVELNEIQSFQYTPLESGNHIRYFSLHHSRKSPQDLGITISHASVDHLPYFEAISYVWGDPKDTEPIPVVQQDGDNVGKILIT
jgi:hypothetical protein